MVKRGRLGLSNQMATIKYTSPGLGTTNPDTVPDAFTFTDKNNVALATVFESDPIQITGITSAPITISGTNNPEYKTDGQAYTNSPGTIHNLDILTIKHTSSSFNGIGIDSLVTIGGVSDTFTTITVGDPGGAPTYSPQFLASFAGGTDGEDFLNNTTPAFQYNFGAGVVNQFTTDIDGPFGSNSTGKFFTQSGATKFGGGWASMSGKSVAEGSDTWLRWAIYLPTSFCSGHAGQSDGYGATKWMRLGYSVGNGGPPDRLTMQMREMSSGGGSCITSPACHISHCSIEFGGGERVIRFPGDMEFLRNQWYFPQMRVHHSTSNSIGFMEFWIDETYLGRGFDVNAGSTELFATNPPGDFNLDNMRVGDYWNGGSLQNTFFYEDEFIFYNATGDPPNTQDSGGRPFISPDHQVTDF
jgi:hypothetical protein